MPKKISGKPFWFSSLGQQVQFGGFLKFCRTFGVELFCSLRVYRKKNKTGTSKKFRFFNFRKKRKMRILNSLIVPKYIKGETLWAFWHFSLMQNIRKPEGGALWRQKKIEKSRTVPKKIARKSFWLKQGLEPVTAGFTVKRVLTSTRERVKSVKSGTNTMRSVV